MACWLRWLGSYRGHSGPNWRRIDWSESTCSDVIVFSLLIVATPCVVVSMGETIIFRDKHTACLHWERLLDFQPQLFSKLSPPRDPNLHTLTCFCLYQRAITMIDEVLVMLHIMNRPQGYTWVDQLPLVGVSGQEPCQPMTRGSIGVLRVWRNRVQEPSLYGTSDLHPYNKIPCKIQKAISRDLQLRII